MTKKEKDMIALLWADERFSLTGSRYWNQRAPELVKINKCTDVDFVADHDYKTIDYLSELGFVGSAGSIVIPKDQVVAYPDGWTTVVLYFGHIQVIFKKNLELYLKVQSSIGPEFYYHYLWKQTGNTTASIQATLAYLYSVEDRRLKGF